MLVKLIGYSMAFIPQINIIFNYLLTIFEGMTPAIYGGVKFARYSGPVFIEDLDVNITDRAVRLYVEGNNKKPRAMYGSGYVRQRGNLVISIYYGKEITELLAADQQGIESMIMADESQLRAKMISPVLFGGLPDQDYDRPVFANPRRKTSKKGNPINELLFDFEWKQPVTEA